MATCFALPFDRLGQRSYVETHSVLLCTVGSHITYTVYAETIKNIKFM